MDMNVLLSKCKLELGIGKYLKIDMSDEELADKIVRQISLPMFSRYCKNRYLLRGINLDRVDDEGRYIIPLPKNVLQSFEQFDVQIKGLQKLVRNEKAMGAYFNSPLYVPNFNGARYNSSFGLDSFANSMTYASMAEAFDPGLNPIFIEPYYIQMTDPVVNYSLFKFDLTINTTHANNLSTIPDSLGTLFEKLVLLDLKKVLYNTDLKYIDNLETPVATVQLKIDSWANAESEKEDFINTELKKANLLSSFTVLY